MLKNHSFTPLYLSKVLKPLNKILKDENSPHLVNQFIYTMLVNHLIVIWNIVKHLFFKFGKKNINNKLINPSRSLFWFFHRRPIANIL